MLFNMPDEDNMPYRWDELILVCPGVIYLKRYEVDYWFTFRINQLKIDIPSITQVQASIEQVLPHIESKEIESDTKIENWLKQNNMKYPFTQEEQFLFDLTWARS